MLNILPSNNNPFVPAILEAPKSGAGAMYAAATTPTQTVRPVATLEEARRAAQTLCTQNPGSVPVVMVNDAAKAEQAGLKPIRTQETDANGRALYCCLV